MKISKFDKPTCRVLREKLQEVLNSSEDLQDLEVKVGSMSYDDTKVSIRLELNVRGAPSEDEVSLDNFIKAWPEKGKTSIWKNNGNYTLIGLRWRNRKYPFIYRDNRDQKTYKTSREGMEKKFVVKTGLFPKAKETSPLQPLDDMMERHRQRLKLAGLEKRLVEAANAKLGIAG